MGNQQERLIWLAGFIDGEGYLGVKKVRKERDTFSGYQLSARMMISNTSGEAFREVKEILDQNKVKYSVYFPKPKQDYWKPAFKISIDCQKPVQKLLNLVSPYLIVKRNQAFLLSEFIDRRKALVKRRYEKRDIEIWQQIKELNQVSSETIRQNALRKI